MSRAIISLTTMLILAGIVFIAFTALTPPASISFDIGKTCFYDCLVGQIVPLSITISSEKSIAEELPVEITSTILNTPVAGETLLGKETTLLMSLGSASPGEYDLTVTTELPPATVNWIRKLFFDTKVSSTEKIKVRYPDIKIKLHENYEKTRTGIYFENIEISNEEKILDTTACKIQIKINEGVETYHSLLEERDLPEDYHDEYHVYETEFMNVTHTRPEGLKEVEFYSKDFVHRIAPTITPICNINGTIVEIPTGKSELKPIIVRD